MLVEDKTDDALTVRDFSTLPDTPIIALSKRSFDNQMWKYSTPVQFVSIDYITFHVLESNILSLSSNVNIANS